jgi:hypothetical protein
MEKGNDKIVEVLIRTGADVSADKVGVNLFPVCVCTAFRL